MTQRSTAIFCLGLCVSLLTACASGRLAGVVVEGPTPAVLAVRADDPRLNLAPIEGALVHAMLDPRSLGGKRLNPVYTDADGRFELDLSGTGAGLLQYELGVWGRGNGYKSVGAVMPVPGRGRTLLIVLTPGRGSIGQPPPDEWLGDTLRSLPPMD